MLLPLPTKELIMLEDPISDREEGIINEVIMRLLDIPAVYAACLEHAIEHNGNMPVDHWASQHGGVLSNIPYNHVKSYVLKIGRGI